MPYRTAFLDWLACASAGREEPAARAAEAAGDGLLERVLSAGTAGHVLDFDDTYLPGLAHLSAPTAPAALVLGAALGRSVGEVVAAYTSGFEAMGAVARASHPALYDGGWHPTAVCGVVGAAISAAQLLGLSTERERAAVAIALLRAGGLRAAFGSDGKALQVGMAAAAGVLAARLAEGGASVPLDEAARGAAGFEAVFGASFAEPSVQEPAVRENWIKAWPCCLQIHGAIEAADRARADGLEPGTQVELIVHPISMEAARCGPQPADGLQAKFSIYYCTAFTLLHGPPGLDAFRELDAEAARLAGRVRVRTDDALLESEAVLLADGREVRVEAALGSPGHPLDAGALAAKLRDLGGERLVGALDDPDRPASSLLEAAGLG
ncbi:MAG: MmgE/PrpD family protein [Actinomycetota bacterium]